MTDTTTDEPTREDDNRIELWFSSLHFKIDLPDNPDDITDVMVVEAAQELMTILNDFRQEERVDREERMRAARADAGKHTHFYFDDTQSAPKEKECSCIIAQDHTDPNPYEAQDAEL